MREREREREREWKSESESESESKEEEEEEEEIMCPLTTPSTSKVDYLFEILLARNVGFEISTHDLAWFLGRNKRNHEVLPGASSQIVIGP